MWIIWLESIGGDLKVIFHLDFLLLFEYNQIEPDVIELNQLDGL